MKANGVQWEQAPDGIIHLVLHTEANDGAINPALMTAFEACTDRIESERSAISGVIIRSGNPRWFGRTDLDPVATADSACIATSARHSERMARALRRIELTVPCAVVIAGHAVGAGLEIALACHHRICLNDPALRIGLPDIGVGMLPALAGTTRIVRMMGFADAWNKILMPGATVAPETALKLGLVDELAGNANDLIPAATRWLLDHPATRQPWDVRGWQMPGGPLSGTSTYFALHAMPALLRKKLRGARNPGPLALLSAAVEGAFVSDFGAASEIERRYQLHALNEPVTHHLAQALHTDLARIEGSAWHVRGADELRQHLSHPTVVDGTALPGVGAGAEAFATRVARAMVDQAMAMLMEGIPAPTIEQASLQAGFAVSALELADAIGPGPVAGSRLTDAGRSVDCGPFHEMDSSGKKRLWKGLTSVFPIMKSPSSIAIDELQTRLLGASAREAVRCVKEGILEVQSNADLISILGAGFPDWTGGALRYASNNGLT